LQKKDEFIWKGRVYKKEDYRLESGDKHILILDIEPSECSLFDINKVVTLLGDRKLLVVHYAEKSDL